MKLNFTHAFKTSFETRWYISKRIRSHFFWSVGFLGRTHKKCAMDTAALHELLLLALHEAAAAPYYLTLIVLSLALYVSLC